MAKTYRPYCPDQMFLLPPSLRDWLPENHLVYFVSDVVDQLDLSKIEAIYEKDDRGQLLRNGLNRGDEAVPHIPYPGELSHLIPENPAV